MTLEVIWQVGFNQGKAVQLVQGHFSLCSSRHSAIWDNSEAHTAKSSFPEVRLEDMS